MKRLSLNSDGAFLTIIHSLIPHSKIINSTEKEENNPEIYFQTKEIVKKKIELWNHHRIYQCVFTCSLFFSGSFRDLTTHFPHGVIRLMLRAAAAQNHRRRNDLIFRNDSQYFRDSNFHSHFQNQLSFYDFQKNRIQMFA